MPQRIKDKKSYRDVYKKLDIPVFMEPWWLDITSNEKWDIVCCHFDQRDYFWIYFQRLSKLGKEIIPPPFTQHLSPFPIDHNYSKVFEELFAALPKHNFIEFTSSSNELINSQGFEIKERYTFKLLEKDFDALRSNYSKSLLRKIKKGDDLAFTTKGTSSELLTLTESTFQRKNQTNPYDMGVLKKLSETAITLNRGVILSIKENNVVHACGFYVWDKQSMYYIIGGVCSNANPAAMSVLMDKAIQIAIEKGLTFDFEGSMIPGVAEFYRRFGALKTKYFEYKKTSGVLGVVKKKFRDYKKNKNLD